MRLSWPIWAQRGDVIRENTTSAPMLRGTAAGVVCKRAGGAATNNLTRVTWTQNRHTELNAGPWLLELHGSTSDAFNVVRQDSTLSL
jgi:hypothetical protein